MNWWANQWRNFTQTERKLALLMFCMFGFGSIGINLSATKNLFEPLSSFTLLYAFFVLMIAHKSFSFRFTAVLTFAFCVGLAVEIIGVLSGKIFGRYEYTDALGSQLMTVPFIIGINWISLTYVTNNIAAHLTKQKHIATIIAALAMVGFDVLIEPLAIKHHFWIWLDDGLPPLQNYISWFAVSLVLSLTYQFFITTKLNFMAILFSISLIFFLLADLLL